MKIQHYFSFFSFSAGKKEAKESRLAAQNHFYSKAAAVQLYSSDKCANVSHDGRQSNKVDGHRAATGTFVSPFMMAARMSSGEHTSNPTHPEPHHSVGKLKDAKCSEFELGKHALITESYFRIVGI